MPPRATTNFVLSIAQLMGSQMCTAAGRWKRIARHADALGEIARQASNI
jgi:hypothetical protein